MHGAFMVAYTIHFIKFTYCQCHGQYLYTIIQDKHDKYDPLNNKLKNELMEHHPSELEAPSTTTPCKKLRKLIRLHAHDLLTILGSIVNIIEGPYMII